MLWSKKEIQHNQGGQNRHLMPNPIQPLSSPMTGGMQTPMVGGMMPKGGGNGDQVSGATTYEIFKVLLTQSIDPENPDEQRLWTYNIPVLSANQKKLMLEVLGGQVVIVNLPTTTFPTAMYLSATTTNGYNDNSGDPTHIIAIYRIRQLIPCVVNNVVTYTIIYSCLQPQVWDLGTQRIIQFKFGDKNGYYNLPLAQQVSFQFRIMHISY